MTVFVQRLNCAGTGPTVAVKDSIDVAGLPTRAGSRALQNAPVADSDADVVATLRAAGWRVIGKTNMHELAFGTTGVNRWTGTPVNPLFPSYIPGGSSSGSAAAVASGMVDAALGTDTGGSVRVPAACCGVFGLKPTFGRVSRRGAMPDETTLDCVGPFAADMERLVACMRGIDPTFAALPVLDNVRIGRLDVPAEAWITRAITAAVGVSGFTVWPVHLRRFDEAYQAGLAVINAETWAACRDLVGTGLVGADVTARLLKAAHTTAAELSAAEQVRAAFTDEVDKVLQSVDVIALPTLAAAPPLVAQADDLAKLVGITALVRPFNLSGHPAIAVPLPPVNGVPVSLQLVAARGRDEFLCAVAAHVAAAVGADA